MVGAAVVGETTVVGAVGAGTAVVGAAVTEAGAGDGDSAAGSAWEPSPPPQPAATKAAASPARIQNPESHVR